MIQGGFNLGQLGVLGDLGDLSPVVPTLGGGSGPPPNAILDNTGQVITDSDGNPVTGSS